MRSLWDMACDLAGNPGSGNTVRVRNSLIGHRKVVMIRRSVMIAALALGACAGCSGTGSPLGVQRSSIVQGLPVPHDATLTRGSVAEYSAHYYVANAGSVNNLNGWYEEELQPGRPWHEWSACP